MIQTLIQARRILWTMTVPMLVMFALPTSAQVQLLHPTNTVWRYQTNLVEQAAAGTDWVNPGFDDSAWPEGKGLFGNEPQYPYPMHTTGAGLVNGLPVANYFRAHFTWSGSIAGIMLTGTNYIDDGSIIYLNGVEIARFNMGPEANAGTPEASAPVANPGGYPNVNSGEPVLVRLAIPLGSLTNGNPNPLVPGDNVIAVQAHQQGTASSDRVFGLALYGGEIPPCLPDSTLLTNRTLLEGRSTTFTIVANCLPLPTIQWYRDVGAGEEVIPGATGTSYTLTNADQPFDTGLYYAKVTTLSGTVMSRQAYLEVYHDDIWPKLISARLGGSELEVIAVVNEALCQDASACGTDSLFPLNWEILNADNTNETLNINAIVQNGLELRFTLEADTPWRPDTRYIVRPFNFGGTTEIGDLFGLPMAATSVAITAPAASAISVKAITGSDLYTFDVAPSRYEFSTFNWAGANSDAETLTTFDAAALALNAAVINQPLPVATGNPPVFSSQARYASDRKNLITRPTSVLGIALLAHLRNDTGVAQRGLIVTYSLADRDFGTFEEVPGHLVYYSFTGASNTWNRISGLYNSATSGSKTGVIDVTRTPWPAGAEMYILFADDNGNINEGAYEIDNFKVSLGGVAPPDTNAPVLIRASAINNRGILLTFSEPMGPPAANTAAYVVEGATVTSLFMNSNRTQITLVTTARAVGNAALTITGIADGSPEENVIMPNPTTVNITTVSKVVDWNAAWEYNTNNLDAVADWTTTGGAGWQTGNGLFGTEVSPATIAALPAPIATPIPPPAPDATGSFLTTYYRKQIILPALAAGQSYAIGHVIDDGAVFYLDGIEIGRFNMPDGSPGYVVTATTGIEGARLSLPFAASSGAHTLAVEVHQNSNTSADTLFGAAVLVVPTASPSLSVGAPFVSGFPAGTNVTIQWNADSSWTLVGSTNVAGPYAPVVPTTRNSLTRPVTTPSAQFYKLNYIPQP